MSIQSSRVSTPYSLSPHLQKIQFLEKEIKGIEDLKASRYWQVFTTEQKQRWNEQLDALRRSLIVYSSRPELLSD